ncbi:MAG: hypothetical protein A3A62_03295 [Candidatus Blackburnbacteria bacterium RIFCSPLOWO2_01_FULL_44_43]|nr:MAG: hypothetical protein A3A62_03295 [Candidatus Blackburnbacteria bacterium RIFCSPLOWO2_01_FULL_44_43]
MKATRPGPIVAIALENYSGTETSKINGFIRLGLADPSQVLNQLSIDSDGSLITPNLKIKTLRTASSADIKKEADKPQLEPEYDITDVGTKLKDLETSLAKLFEKITPQIGSFSESVIANLQAGIITVTEISSDLITAKEIRGENIISPLIEVDYLKAKTAEIQDATISGTLTANTIYTDRIYANQIDGIQGVFEEVVASRSATQELAFQKASKETSSVVEKLKERLDSLSDKMQEVNASQTTYAQTEKLLKESTTDSGVLEFAENWSTQAPPTPSGDLASTGNLNILGDINAFGTTRLAQTYVGDSLTITSSDETTFLSLSGNTITAFGGTLQLIASTQIELMNGTLIVDATGNVKINGNLYVSGSIESKTASTESIIIASPTNSDPNTINSSTESNATAGKATLPAGETIVTIANTNVTDSTLVYVTPNSPTGNQVLYIKNKLAGESFTVAVDNPLTQDVEFSWWVIELKQ